MATKSLPEAITHQHWREFLENLRKILWKSLSLLFCSGKAVRITVKQQLENTEEIICQCCLVGGLLFTVSYLNYTDFWKKIYL